MKGALAVFCNRLYTLKSRLTHLMGGVVVWGLKASCSAVGLFRGLGLISAWSVFFQNVAFPFNGLRCPKVDQIADSTMCYMHVVKKLFFVFRQDGFDCLQFRDNRVVDDKVGDVALPQFPSFIVNLQCRLGFKWNTPSAHFYFKAFLVNFLAQPGTEFFVHFKDGSHQCIAFVSKIFSILCHSVEDKLRNPILRGSTQHGYRWISSLDRRRDVDVSVVDWFKRYLSAFKRSEKFVLGESYYA